MDLDFTLAGLGMLVIALLSAGLLVGFLSGLLGIGGGGIMVPVLYETFTALGVDPDIRMHMAIGTSLAVIVPTSLRSFAAHRAKGAVDMDALKRMAPWIVLGVVIGVLIADQVSSDTLKWVWVVFGTVFAAKMAIGTGDWRLGTELPNPPKLEIASTLIGIASVLLSIAGAAFTVTLLTLYNRPILKAVATSSGFGPLIAIPGMIGLAWAGWGDPGLPPLSLGYISVVGALIITSASLLTAPLGVRAAHGIPRRYLELAFAAFLAIVATRFLVSLILD